MQTGVYLGRRGYFSWGIISNQRLYRMQWGVDLGMGVYFPWETIWNVRFFRMQWVVYFGMGVYFPWEIIWNQRLFRMQLHVYLGMLVYLPWGYISDSRFFRMKEQILNRRLLEFGMNIYFNYKFIVGACPPSTPYAQRNSLEFHPSFLHSKSTFNTNKLSRKIYYH